MKQLTKDPPGRTETLYSPALYLGSISVSEKRRRAPGLLSGTRLKNLAFPALHWLVRHTPGWFATQPARLVTWFLRRYYCVKSNRLRVACEAVCKLHGSSGESHEPRDVYDRYLDNSLGVIENFFTLYREGGEAVLPHIALKPDDAASVRDLIERHGGAVLAVPHNLGSALSALRVAHTFNMLLVAKNPPTPSRTRIALDFYERMKLSVLMVRGGNPFALARAMFTELGRGKLVAATLDNLDRTGNSVTVAMFGQRVALAGWAARIAARAQVPIVPAWFSSTGNRLQVKIGQPLLTDDIQAAVQHYADFFERQILADPASWAYLADKQWQPVLAGAAHRVAANRQAGSS
jgi:hypothetical protein